MSATLEILPYDRHWPEAFRRERDRIAAALGPVAVRIDHHGSTAVPGLGAKPIIDIQISVEQLQPLRAYARGLAELGYVHVPHPDDAFCPFFHRPPQWPHTHHIHVVEAGGQEERRTLAFRDYLREHEAASREYEALKKALAPRYHAADFSSRQAYADAKAEFIARITERAIAEGFPREFEPRSPTRGRSWLLRFMIGDAWSSGAQWLARSVSRPHVPRRDIREPEESCVP